MGLGITVTIITILMAITATLWSIDRNIGDILDEIEKMNENRSINKEDI